jgi:hypothetical protein
MRARDNAAKDCGDAPPRFLVTMGARLVRIRKTLAISQAPAGRPFDCD